MIRLTLFRTQYYHLCRRIPENDAAIIRHRRLERRLLTTEKVKVSNGSEAEQPSLAPSSIDPQKAKDEIAAKLKAALLDAAKPKKAKTSQQSPAASSSSSAQTSTAATTNLAQPPAAGGKASTPAASMAASTEASPQLRRETTFERLKRVLDATTASSSSQMAMPPPNAVRISPHLVTRSQVTPARNVVNLVGNVSLAAIKSSLSIPPMIYRGFKWLGGATFRVAKDPSIIKTGSAKAWVSIKHEAAHYWTGFKVLGLELKTSSRLFAARLQGKELTRREKQQLSRTFTDVLRMGPFLVFVIVPFMEFTLPIFLKLFPNMLPSPFIDPKQKDLTRKNIGQLRLEMASFMQEMVADIETKVRAQGADAKTVSALVEFVESSRRNEPLKLETIQTLVKTFSDEMTIERMDRGKLQMMCRYMGVSTIGSDEFLRYSLVSRLKAIRADDAQISWEGVESLSLEELKQAALERGMLAQSTDLEHYRKQLARWIELSVEHNVSPAMLILSRAFAVAGPATAPSTSAQDDVKQVLESLEPEIVQEALVSAVDDVSKQPFPANATEEDRTVLNKAKLESIKRENELIEDEMVESVAKKQIQSVETTAVSTGKSNVNGKQKQQAS